MIEKTEFFEQDFHLKHENEKNNQNLETSQNNQEYPEYKLNQGWTSTTINGAFAINKIIKNNTISTVLIWNLNCRQAEVIIRNNKRHCKHTDIKSNTILLSMKHG